MMFDFDRFAVHGAIHAVVNADHKGCVWNGVRSGGECHAAFGGNDKVGWVVCLPFKINIY